MIYMFCLGRTHWHNVHVHFRRFVREVTVEWIEIVYGDLPVGAQTYKARLLKVICSTGSKVLERFMRMTHLPQCDWRVIGTLRIHVPIGIDIDENIFIRHVCDSVDETLCGVKMEEYNKSKWNGHEAALDQIITHLGLGGIGAEAYRRLARWFLTRTKRSDATTRNTNGVVA